MMAHEDQNSSTEYEVEAVLAKDEKNGQISYYVQWAGYGTPMNSWVRLEDMQCDELIKEFEDRQTRVMEDSDAEEEVEEDHDAKERGEEGFDEKLHFRSDSDPEGGYSLRPSVLQINPAAFDKFTGWFYRNGEIYLAAVFTGSNEEVVIHVDDCCTLFPEAALDYLFHLSRNV
ncbi:hypothetical protein L596_015456 [Steinernema carpocapsae]|uniref:Chromo domain-containing protein n=1 Tax=Steinernema carpocapsae TaxID=34508 RepID=A0A4U5NG18_STECR|nr:hypothetical protein L596_015456 [Steinernema carpocapsae]